MAKGFSTGAAKSNGRVCFWTSVREGGWEKITWEMRNSLIKQTLQRVTAAVSDCQTGDDWIERLDEQMNRFIWLSRRERNEPCLTNVPRMSLGGNTQNLEPPGKKKLRE